MKCGTCGKICNGISGYRIHFSKKHGSKKSNIELVLKDKWDLEWLLDPTFAKDDRSALYFENMDASCLFSNLFEPGWRLYSFLSHSVPENLG